MGGCQLARNMTRSESFRSIPPDAAGVAWVACRNTVGARQSGDSEQDRQAFCARMAEDVCGGSATYLDLGDGKASANRYRERFRCDESDAGG